MTGLSGQRRRPVTLGAAGLSLILPVITRMIGELLGARGLCRILVDLVDRHGGGVKSQCRIAGVVFHVLWTDSDAWGSVVAFLGCSSG